MDADTLVLENIDDLFDREELSAAPDAGWPDCFNSGVFVFRPSHDTYRSLLHFAVTHGSFDGGDQGLLNLYYSDWSTKDITLHYITKTNFATTFSLHALTHLGLPCFEIQTRTTRLLGVLPERLAATSQLDRQTDRQTDKQ